MTRKDLMVVYGRTGLAIAAFVLVAGIIAAPVLPKWGSALIVTAEPQDEPAFRSLITSVNLKTH